MSQQINVRYALSPKRAVTRHCIAIAALLLCARNAPAQRLATYAVDAGAAMREDARTTAAFNLSAGVSWQIPWLLMLQRSIADLDNGAGTVRDISFAVLPAWEPLSGRLIFALGGSLHDNHSEIIGAGDNRSTFVGLTGVAGFRVPVAGAGLSLEVLGRADVLTPEPQYTALFGVRVRPGTDITLIRGERVPPAVIVQRAAVWTDVLMQLILLQQSLESFTRIREIDTGIELEFDMTAVTLYDDVAKAARVLAAAQPPVIITVFAPNAGRTGAAVTAGSFPAERLRLQRDSRVYLRVEH
jgi:hypothetical protein